MYARPARLVLGLSTAWRMAYKGHSMLIAALADRTSDASIIVGGVVISLLLMLYIFRSMLIVKEPENQDEEDPPFGV